MDKEEFIVKFEHIIAPNIVLCLENESVEVSGTVKISIDNMLVEFTKGLGLKSIFDSIIEKYADSEGYHLNIKNIANADICIKGHNLHVSAIYRASKEWWAKPVAIIVLGKLLGDFAQKVESCGIEPGFRGEIKRAMQQLRKRNSAILDLRNLFEKQKFFTNNYEVNIENFVFENVKTASEDGRFVITILGRANMEKRFIKN